jgi:hypothetical protein
MSSSRVRELAAFEMRRLLHDRLAWIGAAVFAAVLGLGAWQYWNALPPRPENSRLFSEAYILALVIAAHAGLARDRMARFDAYLCANFADPLEVYGSKVISTLVYLAGFAVFAFACALATSAGDVSYAAHYAGLFFLGAVLILPAVILAELALNTRHAIAVLVILFFATLVVYGRNHDVRALMQTLGLDGSFHPVGAAVRTVAALAAVAACYPLFRLRLGRHSLAVVSDSP